MSKLWEAAAARSGGDITPGQFEAAAYRLVSEQVLYHADKNSRLFYGIVERYTREFETALEPLGIEVKVNPLLRYVYARPHHAKSGTASVTQTLLALVLRTLYDEAMRSGQMNDNGEVLCDVVELEEKYRLATGRELPSKMEFDALLRQFKRWGIAKMADEQNIDEIDSDASSMPYILIRPAIVDVLGEAALQRLGHWAQHKAATATTTNEEPESDEEAV
jgi:hypothetical protein